MSARAVTARPTVEVEVEVDSLSKRYAGGVRRRTAVQVLRERLGGAARTSPLEQAAFALRDISFTVERGEMIGLIGHNGAGKTTLLKVLAGLHRPSTGTVALQGRPTYLAGLGLGMLEQLTVRDNAFLYGAIYGLDRAEMRARLGEILAWAGLEGLEEAGFRTLSSGMRTRLAFSIARLIEADLYLYDEVMSTGDQAFRRKCDRVFEDFRDSSKTFILSSHNLEFVRSLCQRALWLDHGRLVEFGDSASVVEAYRTAQESP